MSQALHRDTHDLVEEFETKHNRDFVEDLDDDDVMKAGSTCGSTSSCCVK